MKNIEKLDELTYYKLTQFTPKFDKGDVNGYNVIEKTIEDHDEYDGGAEYNLIIQRISDGKYFRLTYSDWDVDNTDYDEETDTIDGRCDFDLQMVEVFPREITKIIYE